MVNVRDLLVLAAVSLGMIMRVYVVRLFSARCVPAIFLSSYRQLCQSVLMSYRFNCKQDAILKTLFAPGTSRATSDSLSFVNLFHMPMR